MDVYVIQRGTEYGIPRNVMTCRTVQEALIAARRLVRWENTLASQRRQLFHKGEAWNTGDFHEVASWDALNGDYVIVQKLEIMVVT